MTTFPELRCRMVAYRLAARACVVWERTYAETLTATQLRALYDRAFLPYAHVKLLKRLWGRDHDVEGIRRLPGFW